MTGNLGAVLASGMRNGMTEEQARRIAAMNGLNIGQAAGTPAANNDWLAGLGTAVTTPYSTMSEGLFDKSYRGNPLSAATAEQAGTLGQIRDAYSRGDMDSYTKLVNGLQTNGQFVSVAGVNGAAPTGYMIVNGGPAGGHMAMVLDGKAVGGLPTGSVLQDGYGGAWRVLDDKGTMEAVPRVAPGAGAAAAAGALPTGGAAPAGRTPAPSGSAAPAGGGSSGGTAYQQAIASYDAAAAAGPAPAASAAPQFSGQMPETRPFSYDAAPEYGGSDFDNRRNDLLARLEQSQFDYDHNTDPVWQAYAKQYRREGQRATADTLARASGMTGGVPSSYAVSAAGQAGNYYAAQLADRIPQLYQDAYNRYLQQYQQQLGLLDTYNQLGQQDYNRFRDTLGQYNTDRSFAYGQYADEQSDRWKRYLQQYGEYQDQLGQYNADRSFDYGRYLDEMERAERADERAYSRQWNEDERDYNRGQDAQDRARQAYLDQYSADQDAMTWARQAYLDRQSADEAAQDRALTERQYQDKLDQQAFDNALDTVRYLGYVPDWAAQVLGLPAGISAEALGLGSKSGSSGSGSRGSSRSSGGSGSGSGSGNESGAAANEAEGQEPSGLTNRSGNGWIEIPGHGRFTNDEIQRLIKEGSVVKVNRNGSITYAWNNGAGAGGSSGGSGISGSVAEIGNRNSNGWVDLGNNKRVSLQELFTLVENGDVAETYRDGKYWYTWARDGQNAGGAKSGGNGGR